MPISVSDLAFVYSGGASNSDPDLSVGGQPSAYPIIGTLNNLFPDITANEATDGYTDYKCFYIFNDSLTDALYAAQARIQTQVPDGSTATIGFLTQNDIQAITVHGSPTGGTFTVQYETYQAVIAFADDPTQFAINVASGLNGLGYLSTVRCVGAVDNGAITVTIYFENADGNRFHPELVILTNAITGSTDIVVTKLQDGSPINSVPGTIADTTLIPAGIQFNNFGINNPYTIGNFYPGDGLPVWIQRYTPVNADGVRNDGILFRLTGEPSPVVTPIPQATFSYEATGGITTAGDDLDEMHGPGFYETTTDGGVQSGGDAEYVTTDYNNGLPHFYYNTEGGPTASGISITKLFPYFHYASAGGVSISTHNYVSVASTSGIDFVSTCQIFSCETFPISWYLTVFGTPIYSTCNSSYVPQSSRLDFDPFTCTWRGTIGNGDPTNTGQFWYFELAYETVQQMWVLQSHTPLQESDNGVSGFVPNCVLLDIQWTAQKFNCCGDNNLTNASLVGADFHNLQVYLSPVKYCTPKPCSYLCGKCCREFKCPTTYLFTTYFDVGSSCYNSPLHGTFELTKNDGIFTGAGYGTVQCGWSGNIPGTTVPASWFMQFDPVNHIWVIYIYDPTFTYVMAWQASDADFQCCGYTTWTMTPGQNECLDSNSNIGLTQPLDSSTCQ